MGENFDLKAKRTAIFITGAGSGFGRACALSAAKMFQNNLFLIMCGRNMDNLNETKLMVKTLNHTIEVEIFRLDLNNISNENLDSIFSRLLKLHPITHDCYLIIHNAGLLGDVSKLSYQYFEEDVIQVLTNVNFTGTVIVNNLLLKNIKNVVKDNGPLILIVNVSSLCAIQPFCSCSLYCSTKASREMFFRCLAEEWSKNESLKLFVINYAPGPMDTDMITDLMSNVCDKDLLKQFADIKASGKLLQPLMSSDKLFLNVLSKYYDFQSGSRIDYYDL